MDIRRCSQVVAALAMSLVGTGWGWSSGPSKCDSTVANDQIIALVLDQAGLTVHDDMTVSSALAPADGVNERISVDEFEKLMQLELTLHRERKYEPDIKKRYCSVELSYPKTPGPGDEKALKNIPYLNIMTLMSFAGTVDYSIQITDDGTELVTVGE